MALLGGLGAGTKDDFNNFPFSGTAAVLSCLTPNPPNQLDALSHCTDAHNANSPSEGPALVVPGVTFIFGSGQVAVGDWDNSQVINGVANGGLLSLGGTLVIDFTTPTDAFGLDLRGFPGISPTATMRVFAPDSRKAPIGIEDVFLPGGSTAFVGWESTGGIGSVELTETGTTWSPIIDNLLFGQTPTSVPEPSSLFLAGIALTLAAARRRRLARG